MRYCISIYSQNNEELMEFVTSTNLKIVLTIIKCYINLGYNVNVGVLYE